MRQAIDRRSLLKSAAAGAALLAAPACIAAEGGGRKTLRILHHNHFVPGADDWFRSVYAKAWGEANDTDVIVDFVGKTSQRPQARAEVEAQAGHDLVLFETPPPLFETHVIDHREIYEECERRYGRPLDFAIRSTYNPRTKKFYGFSNSYVPNLVNYRADLWSAVGKQPDSWDLIREGARQIKRSVGIPAGIGMADELDTNIVLRSLLACFGASAQTADGVPSFKSKETVEAFKFLKDMYTECMTDEVFTWDASSNNRLMLAGRGSITFNAISITRAAESQKFRIHENIALAPTAAGPQRRVGLYALIDVYVIWKFAQNIEGAKRFLVDYVGASRDLFQQSKFYNLPCFPRAIPDFAERIAVDPAAVPATKYDVFKGVTDWTVNVGYPGYANAAIDEVFGSWVVSRAVASAVRNRTTVEDAVETADRAIRAAFDKWRDAGMV